MIRETVTYATTFIRPEELALAERWERLLKTENTNANKKLKEMIKAEVEKAEIEKIIK